MKRGAKWMAVILPVAWLVAAALIVAGGGCKVSKPYEQAELEDDSLPAPQAVPAYRLPDPPMPAAPAPVAQAAPAETPPVFLDTVENKATSTASFKYSLDERFKRYHRFNCPYAPRQSQGHALAVRGMDLAHQSVSRTTGTRMSRAQIKAKGYRPCQHCRPDLDEPPTWYQGETKGYRERQAVPYGELPGESGQAGQSGPRGAGQVGGYYGDAPPRGQGSPQQ